MLILGLYISSAVNEVPGDVEMPWVRGKMKRSSPTYGPSINEGSSLDKQFGGFEMAVMSSTMQRRQAVLV